MLSRSSKTNTIPHPTFDFYTPAEERANTISHGVGLFFSGAGLLFFLTYPNTIAQRLIFGIFGLSLFLSYLTSTAYHGAEQGWRKHQLRLMDHAAIYLLIAGTYTPFLWRAGASWLSMAILILVWLIALAGVLFKLLIPDIDRFESYSQLSYLSMGWIFPVFVVDVYANLPPHTMTLLIIGGAIYTVGILFYRWESLPYNHAIWHIFTMLAGATHFWAVVRLLLASR